MGKILITGSSGFIGAKLTRMLLDKGYKVKGFDNLSRPSLNLVDLCSNPNFEFQYGDIRNISDVRKAYEDEIDYVFHLAGIVGEPKVKLCPTSAYQVNVTGTENICALKPFDVPLALASTGSVFGKIAPGVICTENHPCNPVSDYAIQKLESEDIVLGYDKTVVYRFATLMGLSPNPRLNLLVNTLVWEAYYNRCLVISQGSFRRSFVSLNDVCKALILSMENLPEKCYGEIYNIGNKDGNVTKIGIANYIASKLNIPVFDTDSYSDPDQRDYEIDFSKAKRDFGFEAGDYIENVVDELIKAIPILENKSRYD
jgi:nucleoside-diphosphate-sugar epimerase